MNDFQLFVDNYISSDFDKIKFDWNGEYGDKFHDNNYDFRMKLCEYLVPKIDNAKIELIRDLYLETAKSSEATFGIYLNIHIFGQELLKRDWRKYLIDYMKGGSYGMDSFLGTGRIEIDKDIAMQILDFISEKKDTTTDKDEKKYFEIYLKRFQWLANK